jgi:hypothetical protein
MSKNLLVAAVLSFSVCAASAQAQLLLGAQYVGSIFSASSRSEKQAKEAAERKIDAEKQLLKNEENQAIKLVKADASRRAKREAGEDKRARYDELEEKFKEDKYQLELDHVRTLNSLGKDREAVAEEKVIYRRKLESLKDSYTQNKKKVDANSRDLEDALSDKYGTKGMAEINKKYHPTDAQNDIKIPTSETSSVAN